MLFRSDSVFSTSFVIADDQSWSGILNDYPTKKHPAFSGGAQFLAFV
jgi:hypothetical protein